MTNVSMLMHPGRCEKESRGDMSDVRSNRRWTLRCRDLLARESYVITQVDPATGHVLLHVTGSKPVLLPVHDAERLRRQLGEAIESAAGERAESQ